MHRAYDVELSLADFQYVSATDENGVVVVWDEENGGVSTLERDKSSRAVTSRFSARAAGQSGRRHTETTAAPIRLCDIAGVVTASRLERPPVPRVSFGIVQIDELTGGIPRGSLTEICGAASSGRTTLMLSAMARATTDGQLCALVDATDCFAPHSAAAAGVDLNRLLWVRCAADIESADARGAVPAPDVAAVRASLRQKQSAGSLMPHAKVWYGRSPARSERDNGAARQLEMTTTRPTQTGSLTAKSGTARHGAAANSRLRAGDRQQWARRVDQALRVTDLLLQGGGFGMVIVDLGDVPPEIARRVPLTSWFRFRRAVENTPTVVLSVVRQSCAKTCASLVLEIRGNRCNLATETLKAEQIHIPDHARIFTGLNVAVELTRTTELRTNEKKPPSPARTEFQSQTEWANMRLPGDRAIG